MSDNDTTTSSSTSPTTPVSRIANSVVRRQLILLCAAQVDIRASINALEAEAKENLKKITALASKHKIPKTSGDGWLLLPPSSRRVLKKELLLQNGVTTKQIEDSTVEEPGKNYSVRTLKDVEEE